MAAFIVLALAAGALFQIIATISDGDKYPPPGKTFAVRGQQLHIYCTGSGSPTVILEAGLGGGSLDWSLVQPEVAKFGRVCSYDRAGFAWSSPGVGRRDAAAVTGELHELLAAANIAPPYVMAGHSIGGIYVQLFAAQYPGEVAGVVLVDSSHQDQLESVPGIPSFVPYLFKAAARVGIPRILNQSSPEPELSVETNAARSAMYSHTQTVDSEADEMTAIPESLAELRASPMQLGAKPLIVLARGRAEGSPQAEAVWRDLQTSLATHSANSKLVIAPNSGHYIHFSESALVVEAIRSITLGPAGGQ